MIDSLLTVEEWAAKFDPILDDEETERIFDTGEEAKAYIEDTMHHGTKSYSHVWTRVSGDSGKLILLNGWHLVNKLDYLVTRNSWSSGDQEIDSNTYIEVTYEH